MATPEKLLPLWIALGVLAVAAIALALSYNRFVSQRNLIRDSWANVETELRRRYDLIPNLVSTVKGYAAHERELLEHLAAVRANAAGRQRGPGEQTTIERDLVGTLQRVFAVAENYPDLRASQNFLELQEELANTEDRIQASRRFFNNNVRGYNERVQSFPSMIVARMFGFREAEYFEVEEAIRRAPVVDA
jgi:LemA protein